MTLLAKLFRPCGFKSFLRGTWSAHNPMAYVDGRHVDLVCDALECQAPDTELVLTLPPGHSKSSIISRAWAAYQWLRDPSLPIITVSYDPELAERDARGFKSIVESEYFQRRRELKVLESPVFNLRNSAGGTRLSTSIGGRITGYHGSLFILDDLVKAQGVTPAALEDVRVFFKETLPSRRLPGSRLIVTGQRLAMNDASGLAIEEGAKELLLPVRYQAEGADLQDWRKKPGALLWPERFREEQIDKIARALGSKAFSAQYQGRPVALGGNIIKEEWIAHYDEPPAEGIKRVIITGDLAFEGKKSSDFCVFQVWLETVAGCFYLVAQRRGQWDFTRSKAELMKLVSEAPEGTHVYLEKAANGAATLSALEALLGNRLHGVVPKGSKENRLAAVAPLFEEGRVFVPTWFHTNEWTEFPAARYDDTVDAMSLALSTFSEKSKSVAWWDGIDAFMAGRPFDTSGPSGVFGPARSTSIGGYPLSMWAIPRPAPREVDIDVSELPMDSDGNPAGAIVK